MRNASADPHHRLYSFLGVPENIWMQRILGAKETWTPSFGTVIRIETREYPSPGTQIQLYVADRDGSPWIQACQRHRNSSKQNYAFIFRDPHTTEKIYSPSVSNLNKNYTHNI